MRTGFLGLAGLLAVPALADEGPLDHEALLAIVAGKTLHYEQSGIFYGREQFSEDGKSVTWQYEDGACETALWEAQGASGTLMCFYYDPASCWRVYGDGSTLVAHLVDPPSEQEYTVDVVRIDTAPLDCPINAISSLDTTGAQVLAALE